MMLFVDLETTGLDPDQDCILELAIKGVADDGKDLSYHTKTMLIQPMPNWLERINSQPVVLEMHSANRLVDAIQGGKDLPTPEEAQDYLVQWLHDLDIKPGTQPMCGSSVHFDRMMLARHMPKVEAFFHHRNIDVSTLKELVKRWYPDLPRYEEKSSPVHRAHADILRTMNELHYYRRKVFNNLAA